jgi:hypothetical protein
MLDLCAEFGAQAKGFTYATYYDGSQYWVIIDDDNNMREYNCFPPELFTQINPVDQWQPEPTLKRQKTITQDDIKLAFRDLKPDMVDGLTKLISREFSEIAELYVNNYRPDKVLTGALLKYMLKAKQTTELEEDDRYHADYKQANEIYVRLHELYGV